MHYLQFLPKLELKSTSVGLAGMAYSQMVSCRRALSSLYFLAVTAMKLHKEMLCFSFCQVC